MKYKIETGNAITLVGFKKRFKGVPYGEQRQVQEREFAKTTRAKQWLLLGASCDYTTTYAVITNIDDTGYDYYIGYELDEPTRNDLFNPSVTGVDFMDKMGYEIVCIPRQKYVVFETEKKRRPIVDYQSLRKAIIEEWLASTQHQFINAPEIVKMRWRPHGDWEKERYIAIYMPIA